MTQYKERLLRMCHIVPASFKPGSRAEGTGLYSDHPLVVITGKLEWKFLNMTATSIGLFTV